MEKLYSDLSESYYKHFEYLFVILSIKRNLFDSLGVIKTY